MSKISYFPLKSVLIRDNEVIKIFFLYFNRRFHKWKKPSPILLIVLVVPQCDCIVALPQPTSKQPTMMGVASSIYEVTCCCILVLPGIWQSGL
jgi:hypothetical protein